MSVYDSEPQEFNLKLAEALKKIPEFKKPEWVAYVKSSASNERPIDEEDFWYKRAASILRNIYLNKAVGVSRLRTRYGSKKNRGMKPERFVRAGGKIIRTILQQSDKAELTELVKQIKGIKGRKMGRQLTKKGESFLESIEVKK